MGFSHGHQFSQEEADFILDNYQKYTVEQLTIMMRELFDYPFTIDQIKRKIYDLKIRKRNLKKNFGRYSPEMCQWLKDHYNTVNIDELVKQFNETFDIDYTKSAVWHKLNRIIIGGIVRDEHKMITRTKWTPEMVEWLRNHYEDETYNVLAIKMSELFNVKITGSSMEHKITRLGLKKSKESIKRFYLPNKFCFKKGHIPATKKPIGYERTHPDGFTWVKVAEPDVFKQKHRVIYEQHYGPIPKDCCVIFADGNRSNFDLNNLILVTRTEHGVMNVQHLRSKDAEITKCGVALTKLMIRRSELVNKS